jgi:hypothetical protein
MQAEKLGGQREWVVRTPDELVAFVDAQGCCTIDALPGYPSFPAQSAVIGDVDPAVPHPWFWKDDLHVERRLYYTRVFGNRPGYVSNELLPVLVATNGAVADELIMRGALTVRAQMIYGIIEQHGPIPTKDLKRLLTPDDRRTADTALHDLDRRFIITKTGITGRTLGTYSYVWDLVERWMPDVLAAADRLGRQTAMEVMREHLASFGITGDSPFTRKVLGWED